MGIALRDPRRRVSRLGGCWREVSGGFRSAAPSWLGATRKQAGGHPGRPTKQHRQTGCPVRKSEVWASRKILVTAPEDTALWVDGAGDQRPLRRPLTRSDRREEAGGGYAIRSFVSQRHRRCGYRRRPGGLPFEETLVSRATRFAFPGDVPLLTWSAEGLIILKAFAARGQGWVDIGGIIFRQTGALDWTYVNQQITPLAALKDEPEILTGLARRQEEFER